MAPAADHCRDLHGSEEVAHVAIFPLLAKGHTIPLLDLACLLRCRGLAAVTFLTTPGNAAFVRAALAAAGGGGAGDDDAAVVVELPFPSGHAPAGGEGAERVASASSFVAFAEATSPLRPRLEETLAAMRPPADLLVADGFLYWAHASAVALGVPSVSFLGTSAFATPSGRRGIGVRVHSRDGTIGGLVKSDEIARVVRELMFGEDDGMLMASNVAKLAAQAQAAVSEGGSSWKAVEEMIRELCATSIARK